VSPTQKYPIFFRAKPGIAPHYKAIPFAPDPRASIIFMEQQQENGKQKNREGYFGKSVILWYSSASAPAGACPSQK
jgi:hypothetical protein